MLNAIPQVCDGQLLGCDVSKFQLDVDFATLAKSIAFGFVREGESNWKEGDDKWAVNWKGMHVAGIPCSPYHPPHAGDGREQARILRGRCADWEHGRDIRPVIDLEVEGASRKVAEDMAEEILAQFGVLPILYTGKWIANGLGITRGSILAQCPLWLASYVPHPAPLPDAWDRWTAWQFTDKGRLPGISVNVDLNVIRSRADLDWLRDQVPVGPVEVPRANDDLGPAPVTSAAQESSDERP